MTKRCRGECGKTLELDKFSRRNGVADGRQPYCKECQIKAQRKRRHKIAAREPDFEITVEDPAEPPPPTPLEQAQQERAKTQEKHDTRTQLRAALDENERLKREVEALSHVNSRAPEIIVYEQPSWERSDAIPFALASDWHIEEPVKKATVHGLNEFNLEVARERSRNFAQNLLRLVNIVARDSKVNTIFLAMLGDFFSGWIHEELIANALLAPADAAIFCRDLWFGVIDFLLKESSFVIEGEMLPGNHGRMTRQMHFGNPTGTSLETVMYYAIADRYHGNPRVRLNVSKQAMVYRKFFENYTVRLIHGYEVKYGGGVGGITIPVNKALAQWDQAVQADLTFFGHFHQYIVGGRFIGNGSLIGYNLFAQAIKASFEEARQAFGLIHARNGGELSITAPIWLDKAES